MIRFGLIPLLSVLVGCSVIAPAQQMPAFGAQFEPATHAATTPETATLIVYRDPGIEERIKPMVMLFGVEPFRFNRPIGYSFAGAFLRAERPAGTFRLSVMPHWWDEDPPAGDSFLGRMNVGEPPSEGAPTTASYPPLEIGLEPGTVTYVKLTRSSRSELVTCRETAETASVCRMNIVTTAFERVPPDTAQAELATLRETVIEGEEG